MRISFISDTHGKHKKLVLPETDILIHAGDISKMGTFDEVKDFLDWFAELNIPHKVFVVGNHDFLAERETALFKSLLNDQFIYLENESVTIEGIKIWGSPITPYFFNLAFNRQRGADIKQYWDQIPDDVDILVTHGPPEGFGDKTQSGQNVGCADLLEAVQKIKPKYHVFGHIHEDVGVFKNEHTTFINASVLNLAYQLVNPPIQFIW